MVGTTQKLNPELSVGSLPIKPKMAVVKLVFKWLDELPVGRKFGPSEIQNYVFSVTGGERRPQDGTITRYIRMYNEKGGSIENTSRSRSIYRKNNNREV